MTTSPVRSKFANDVARIAFPDARAAIVARTSALAPEMVSLVVATGRVAVQKTYRAAENIVPFAHSAMDGYALRWVDTSAASVGMPVTLAVVGASCAGDSVATPAAGYAAVITTCAMLPDGADAVVPFTDERFVASPPDFLFPHNSWSRPR